MSKRGLITVSDLSDAEIEEIFGLADSLEEGARGKSTSRACSGKIMATLFYEPSTRTRLSFESAMHRLGGSVISCPDMRSSSVTKGESIADTARVVSGYADILVVRHYWDGAAQVMAEYADVSVINAGDGSHEHPTQTLCDLYTLKKEKGFLKGLTVVICGDLKHGRTVHSLIYALARFGVRVLTAPAGGMELPDYVHRRLESEFHYGLSGVPSEELRAVIKGTDAVYLTPTQPHQLALFTQVDPSVEEHVETWASKIQFDAFYVTRMQKERLHEENGDGTVEYPRLGREFLKEKRFKNTLVMHPLPRVDELSPEIDKDRRGVYFKQAAYGVPIRMALLQFLLNGKKKRPPAQNGKRVLYRSPEKLGARCGNPNCVTRFEPVSAAAKFLARSDGPGRGIRFRCVYCDHQLDTAYTGHTVSKRYCLYDSRLTDTLWDWLQREELVLFDSIKQAEELSYEPYRIGPQRTLMNETEIHEAITQMAQQIYEEVEDRDRLLVLGVRSKGAFLARRLAGELQKHCRRNIEVGEVRIFGAGEGVERTDPEDPASISLEVNDREVILVDDVIHTGRTAKAALSLIFKLGRPQSVRLAVLVDRGHREVPIKPNYVGKPIPSAEQERVRLKLRETDPGERDKVVIYSILQPPSSKEEEASA